ncbi:hypothetical protein A7E78_13555 [Syntrophotalea acetylenivorans]|uniref:Protein kinase domain-containing protein n=1 Tax=Syntrophotalea acetylenivorans TaxID=1842532 RepID=A0A1L3GS87_9BACT|nr:serine/threonine-protein kinase [Syntrophotalea acetylenivorans]APG28765.1 hypothetical protein A7E78_13555 [Syntrophotalea acetylenivorans]
MNESLKRRYCLPLAIGDVITSMLSPFTWGRRSHKYQDSLRIPDDFFGINIASSEDERCDDYVLERLRELGIDNVRLGFSYCSFDGPAARFLEKLLSEKFEVTLVVLPPLEMAREMLADKGVQEQWRSFVAEVFSRYAQRVAVFEIGSTPNRKKWSGFHPRSYLQAWEIACEAAKDHAVILAGPNIQDFEPFYNAAILSAMGRLSRAPDIHTNNLFVERVVEPEAYDHRVLGRWATNLLKFNLAKKARILKSLGKRVGCRQFFSTCKFWSTKRLRRWSLYPQDKKVDYLARYLVLAATSGSLGRVYWGPMICGRDGLIDDLAEDYPTIDHSSFYKRVRGDIEDFTVTPAFFALGHVAQRLRNAYCDHAFSDANGISHFAFTGAENEVFHICWCRDGQAYRLDELYSAEQLADAVFTNACGKIVDLPVTINERPLFIDFPRLTGQQLPEHRSAMAGKKADVFYVAQPKVQAFPWKNRHWRGAFTSIAELPSPALGDLLAPDEVVQRAELTVLRDRRNRLWNIAHPLDEKQQLTVKFNRPRGSKRLLYLFKPSKGLRHWNTASRMLHKGISTPLPVAFYERHRFSGVRDSYYICQYIPGAFSSRQVCNAFRQGQKEYRGLDKQQWFDLLTGFICNMHNAGILHRDLSVGNLMLTQDDDGKITPYLIDIGRAKVVKNTLGGRQRILDLMRICYKLDWPDRELLIQCYSQHWGRSFSSYWRLAVKYYDIKQGGKKKLKGKLKKKR